MIDCSPAQTALRPSDPGGKVGESAGAAEVIGERIGARHKAPTLWPTPRCALQPGGGVDVMKTGPILDQIDLGAMALLESSAATWEP